MAAGRSVWSGYIRFGLVSVPVKAYTATSSSSSGISLNQLHRDCHSRINYKKSCPVHGDIKSDEIVSGYEFAKGQYVVVEADELEKLRAANEKAIDVKSFVSPEEVDVRYFTGKTWYLLPDGPIAVKPYALMYKTLEEQDLNGFAQVVMGGKVQLLMLRPISNLLVGSYISYAAEVKSPSDFAADAPKVEVSPDELKLAKTLTDAMKVSDFDLSEYKDDYTEKMTQLIQAKIEGKQIVAPPVGEAPPELVNLMDALKRSVEQAKKSATAKPSRMAAPSVGTAARHARKRKSS